MVSVSINDSNSGAGELEKVSSSLQMTRKCLSYHSFKKLGVIGGTVID